MLTFLALQSCDSFEFIIEFCFNYFQQTKLKEKQETEIQYSNAQRIYYEYTSCRQWLFMIENKSILEFN